MPPLVGKKTCWVHSAGTQAKAQAARRRGGQKRKVSKAPAPAPVHTLADLQRHTGLALADVQRLPNSCKRGHAIARLLLVALRLIESGELQTRVEALEEQVVQIMGAR